MTSPGIEPTCRLQLASGHWVLVDSGDVALVQKYSWRAYKRSTHTYASTAVHRRTVYLHRLITGAGPTEQVDHINHDTLDNRRENLRLVTHQQNQFNKKGSSGSTSRFKGVCYVARRRKWLVQIKVNGRRRYSGYFDDEVEAAKAYDRWAVELHGSYAYLNFPGGDHDATP